MSILLPDTVKLLLRILLPDTFKLLLSIVLPDTFKVEFKDNIPFKIVLVEIFKLLLDNILFNILLFDTYKFVNNVVSLFTNKLEFIVVVFNIVVPDTTKLLFKSVVAIYLSLLIKGALIKKLDDVVLVLIYPFPLIP